MPKANAMQKQVLYPLYQGIFELHPEPPLSVEECRRKAILYVTDWLKEKMGDNCPAELDQYPSVDDYSGFVPEKTSEIRLKDPFEFRTFCWDKVWTLRMFECSKDFSGEFITNIAVEAGDGSVLLAVRTECRQGEGQKTGLRYRPRFLTCIVDDDERIRVTEPGVPLDYPISRDPIIVNGKSNEECKRLYDGLIMNPGRTFPVLFVPDMNDEGSFEQAEPVPEPAGEKTESLKDLFGTMMGYSYVVVIKRSLRKFFCNCMKDDQYLSRLESGISVILKSRMEKTDGNGSGEEGGKLEDSGFSIGGEYPMGESFKDSLEKLQKEKTTLSFFNSVDFSNTRFNSVLWNQYINDRIQKARDEGTDESLIEALETDNKNLSELLSRTEADLDASRAEVNRLQAECQRSKDRVLQQERDNEREKKELERKREENEKLVIQANEQASVMQDRLFAMMGASQCVTEMADRMVESLSLFPGTSDKEKYIGWIRHYFPDTLILHQNAEKSIRNDAEARRDWKVICYATYFISGFTRYMREKGTTIDVASSRASGIFDPKQYNFKVTRSLTGETKQRYLKDYSIDIRPLHKDKDVSDDPIETVLEYHLRFDEKKDMPLFRIYFLFDAVLGKSVIGSMPEHLRTAGYDG